MKKILRILVAAACLTVACSGEIQPVGSTRSPGSGSSSTTGGSTGGSSGGPAQLCVDTINQYRSTLGLGPYTRWVEQEACADAQAASDSFSGDAHGAFGQCTENAQNECPGWDGPPESMITDCLQSMWNEGPGADFGSHGHYLNMSSTEATRVACGFYTTPTGKVWSVQDFH